MRMSNEEYAAFVDSFSPRSPIWGDLLRAGLVGGDLRGRPGAGESI